MLFFILLQRNTTLKMTEATILVICMAICSMYLAKTDGKVMQAGEGRLLHAGYFFLQNLIKKEYKIE